MTLASPGVDGARVAAWAMFRTPSCANSALSPAVFGPMQTKLLIDSIMRQTTVLIAQLSAAAGMRAPLSHLADEVFLSLSQELEDQGVSRKVVADMFGLALRSYQRRVQRLKESATEQGTTLWQAVLTHLEARGPCTRVELFDRFRNDDPDAVSAVLSDLVRTGLASRTGTSAAAVFAPTPQESRRLLARQGSAETATAIVWLDVCQNEGSLAVDVASRLGLDQETVDRALGRLKREGNLTSDTKGPLCSEALVIPVGAENGWEAAVFDHFQAVAGAIASKLRQNETRSAAADTTGGATLSFEISDTHPLRDEVLSQLAQVRAQTDDLWERVEAENAKHPLSEDEMRRVMFYFGQFEKSSQGES